MSTSEAPQLKPGKQPSRLNVISQTVFQHPGGQPLVVESRWGRMLKSEETPVIRRLSVGPEWVPLYLGWLDDGQVSHVKLENPKPEFHVVPTPEERDKAETMLVEVGINITPMLNDGMDSPGNPQDIIIPFAFFLPGESLELSPVDVKALHVRCQFGTVKINTTVFPR